MLLEYLKVILTTPVMIVLAIVTFLVMFRLDVKALMARIARVKFPGGEIEATQLEKAKEDIPVKGAAPEPIAKEGAEIAAPAATRPAGGNATAEALAAERARAALWEYRYLNYFLAPTTQRILDWLALLKERLTLAAIDALLLPAIPDSRERQAIYTALQAHYLIAINGDLVEVTPKGREYLQWRGPLPPLPPAKFAPSA
jgi:hypothetical protein